MPVRCLGEVGCSESDVVPWAARAPLNVGSAPRVEFVGRVGDQAISHWAQHGVSGDEVSRGGAGSGSLAAGSGMDHAMQLLAVVVLIRMDLNQEC